MKKFIVLIILLFFVTGAHAAGTVAEKFGYAGKTNNVFRVILSYEGDGTIDHDLSRGAMGECIGMYLYQVRAIPDGTDAPTAATVTVELDGQDLLGGRGTGLVHATNVQDTFPYSVFMSSYRFPVVAAGLSVKVTGQTTANAKWTIIIDFVR